MIARALHNAWNLLQRGWLRYTIWETEHYLRDCERDGLVDSLSLDDFRGQLEAQRVQLALLQGRYVAPRADGAPLAAEACTELGSDAIVVQLPRPAFLYMAALVVLAAGSAVFA